VPVTPPRARERTAVTRLRLRITEMCNPDRSLGARLRQAALFRSEVDAMYAHGTDLGTADVEDLAHAYDRAVHDDLLPALAAKGLHFTTWRELSRAQQGTVRRRFRRSTYPLLAPATLTSVTPISAFSMNLAVRADRTLVHLAMPARLPRRISAGGGDFLTTESITTSLLPEVLDDASEECTAFRITRATDNGEVTRLEIEQSASDELVATLSGRVGATEAQVCRVQTALAMGSPFADPRREPDVLSVPRSQTA
jgi:polyphosphate kinase